MNPELTTWLERQHRWLQRAANRILHSDQLSETDINEFVRLIKDPTYEPPAEIGVEPTAQVEAGTNELRLVAIGPVEGIEALNPRVPLRFGDQNLCVIYGHNGSGKSGYSRILAKACGKPASETLKGNIFEQAPARQVCTIAYSSNGNESEIQWSPRAPVEALKAVNIFDSSSGRVYLEGETVSAFMPPELALMSDLVNACSRVDTVLSNEESALRSALPTMQAEFSATEAARAYRGLSHETSVAQIDGLSTWSDENENELQRLAKSLAAEDPLATARKQRAIKSQREQISGAVRAAVSQLTGDEVAATCALISDATGKRKVAEEAAKVLSSKSPLDGIGSETWRRLWNAAREFADDQAYPFRKFPFLEEGARCVFCQQELGAEAQDRLSDFEGYIEGRVETEAKDAEQALADHLKTIVTRAPPEDILVRAQAAELDAPLTELFEQVWTELEIQAARLRQGIGPESEYSPSERIEDFLRQLDLLVSTAEETIQALTESANPEVRQAAENRKLELEAKKWISAQGEAIRVEVDRCKQVEQYRQWRRTTTTTGISRKAGELSQVLVTEAYIQRFNTELTRLGATGLRVELSGTGGERGRVRHIIKLRAATVQNARIAEVLSEGERRILSLAAFLADVTGRNGRNPFVFDDPISSLDQTWEERTVDRLVALSGERQVIIFTHRLSLLGLISEKAEEHETVHIRRESWGTGEPGDVPLYGKNPRAALNSLRDQRLAEARRFLGERGHEAYYPLAKAICSDLRILTERLVEWDLLSDVIQRHRRAVKTMGKIGGLAKITTEDCNLIDEFMTKYSAFEHSQPAEAPVELPTPDQLEADINRLLAWQAEFRARAV